jgi:hypothetical protein
VYKLERYKEGCYSPWNGANSCKIEEQSDKSDTGISLLSLSFKIEANMPRMTKIQHNSDKRIVYNVESLKRQLS